MPGRPRRVYFDANVFLAYVGNEEGRADTVQTLLDEARRGELEIVTSVLSIAGWRSGAHERDHGLTEAGGEAIDQLWTPKSPVTLVDVSQAATRTARTLIRDAKTHGLAGIRGPTQSTSPPPACSAATRSSPTKPRGAAAPGSGSPASPSQSRPRTNRSSGSDATSWRRLERGRHRRYFGPEHPQEDILEEPDSVPAHLIARAGATTADLQRTLAAHFANRPQRPTLRQAEGRSTGPPGSLKTRQVEATTDRAKFLDPVT